MLKLLFLRIMPLTLNSFRRGKKHIWTKCNNLDSCYLNGEVEADMVHVHIFSTCTLLPVRSFF